MPKQIYTLTPEDLAIFEKSKELVKDEAGRIVRGASYFTSYYFRARHEHRGWQFDNKISPPWQLDVHHAPQQDIIVIAGMGAGKTGTIGISACVHCALNQNFKFLNVAPTAWQSKQMYDYILSTAAGTLFEERFMWKVVQKPFPKIILKYKYPNHNGIWGAEVESSLEFMSASEDAQSIRTWEGDWVNVDQAELMDNLTDLWSNLGTRTRGVTRAGRERMGRLSAIANAEDNPELWGLAELAEEYPETNRFFLISTFSNQNLSESQLNSFKRRLGNDQARIDQFLNGVRPLGKGEEFSAALVEGVLDTNLDLEMDAHVNANTPGWEHIKSREAKTILWSMPYDKTQTYVVVGDPGQGRAPLRNAPVVMVFNVTDYPNQPMVLAGFWWGDGGGKYEPWIEQFKYWTHYYHAINAGYDSTGGQKVHSELTFGNMSQVWPIDLAALKKRSYMVTLKLVMQKKLIRLPRQIEGLNYQLLKYKLPDEKIPQDLVSTLFILAGCLWAMGFEAPDDEIEDAENSKLVKITSRYARSEGNRWARPVLAHRR